MTDLLATTVELAEARGVEHDPTDLKALRALEDASDWFRGRAAQTITIVEDDTVELAGNWTRRLWLPERPVISVKDVSIVSVGGTITALEDSSLVVARRGLLKTNWFCDWGGPDATVRITYTHGFLQVPGDVRDVVLARAMRKFTNPTGVMARSIGTFSETFSESSAAVGLTADEAKTIQRYRPVM